MAAAPRPQPVTPRPGLPKTIGVLNLIGGGLLLLCGLGYLNAAVPSLTKNPGYRIDPQALQEGFNQTRLQQIGELDRQEAAASTDAEKAKIRAERAKLEENARTGGDRIDAAKVNRATRGVWLYLWADVVSAPLLNLLMLTAGIGLITLKGWARVLALWVAALKIVRLVALCVFATAVVLPNLSRVVDDVFRTDVAKSAFAKEMEEQRARQGGAAPVYKPEELAQIFKAFGLVSLIVFTCLGMVYPVVVLAVLTRPGARAACSGAAPDPSAPGWE